MSTSKQGPGFHHVAIRAFDFEKTVAFYRDAMGCSRRFGWGEAGSRAAMMDMGDGNYVEIFEGRNDGEIIGEGGVLHFAFRVADVDGLYNRAIEFGATSVMEPKDVAIPGDHTVDVRIAFVKGLAGETIELFRNDEL